jgi:small-conductance mechanosensitive channel
VETAIRFEIDRLFRERNIEISFPQRDIHIRSWVPGEKIAGGKGEAGEKKKPGETPEEMEK